MKTIVALILLHIVFAVARLTSPDDYSGVAGDQPGRGPVRQKERFVQQTAGQPLGASTSSVMTYSTPTIGMPQSVVLQNGSR